MNFAPDRAAYIRSHTVMAAVFMAVGMAVLWLVGNPHVWTGAVGGLAAVLLRGWYVQDEAMAERWSIKGPILAGPSERRVPLAEITTVRQLGSAVQVTTRSGDKHLIKYQADPQATVAAIDAARQQDKA